jgi:hypothetical protein
VSFSFVVGLIWLARTNLCYRLYYLTHVIGYEEPVAQKLIKDRSRKDYRSPSRNRE